MAKGKGGKARAAKGQGPTLIQRSRQAPDEMKALYHHVLGAGRSRVRREFFDLSEADADAIFERVQQGIARQFQKGA